MSRLRGKATKENTERTNKSIASESKVKVLGFYWALGRYDTVLIAEAPDEKTMMKMLLKAGDYAATERMVAIPREEAIKLSQVNACERLEFTMSWTEKCSASLLLF